jgi:hypothetical protein
MIRLWSINRWLRWTGFVLIVEADDPGPNREPTRIGFVFVGWPPDAAWARHCERTRLAAEARARGAQRVKDIEDIARLAVSTVERAVNGEATP